MTACVEISRERLSSALHTAVSHLLGMRHPEGYWEGRLSSSALSTATAVSALSLAKHEDDIELIRAGVAWLAQTQNADGGWGDTPDSPSNLATTLLAAGALLLSGKAIIFETLSRAEAYISERAGETPEQRRAAILHVYGEDRTFAVPILMNCALAGLVPWDGIPGLPFELAVFPHRWYKLLRLHVVSYALPALIAIGLLLEAKRPSRNPLMRLLRRWVTPAVLAKLGRIQPDSGGFLEATPLTAFVAMSLLARGEAHPVVEHGRRFLRASMRDDGSWPIDTNLSVWLTTSTVNALSCAGSLPEYAGTTAWISSQQYRKVHPFTNALPGGWGWTHLAGGVPDADDTAGALIALGRLGETHGMRAGARWLLQLQNTDGGWPTFCRGWGRLPFDKSSPDVTAHALRALRAVASLHEDASCHWAIARGFDFLSSVQQPDGAWVPLWFGNQQTAGQQNAVLGTARVLPAYAEYGWLSIAVQNGVQYLLQAQNPDGGWGGDAGAPSSIEETALTVSALSRFHGQPDAPNALARGVDYLVHRVEDGSWRHPTPIGLYFASLWYSEELYPVIWTVEALGRVAHEKRIREAAVK